MASRKTEKEMDSRRRMANAKGKILEAMSAATEEHELTAAEWTNVLLEVASRVNGMGLAEEWTDESSDGDQPPSDTRDGGES